MSADLRTRLRLLLEGIETATGRFMADYERAGAGTSRRISGEAAAMIVAERSAIAGDIRALLAEPEAETPGEQYVITSLSINGVVLTMSDVHPERTPIGPFNNRESAWEYARQMQLRHGNGGGSVEVAPLVRPGGA